MGEREKRDDKDIRLRLTFSYLKGLDHITFNNIKIVSKFMSSLRQPQKFM